jgi:hypothetical protein
MNRAWKEGGGFLRQSGDPQAATPRLGVRKKHGLAKACRVLFNANEFVFVD